MFNFMNKEGGICIKLKTKVFYFSEKKIKKDKGKKLKMFLV